MITKKLCTRADLESFHFFPHSFEVFTVILELGENRFETESSGTAVACVWLTSATRTALAGHARAFGAVLRRKFHGSSAVGRAEAATTGKRRRTVMSLFLFDTTVVTVTCTRCIVYIKS